RRGWQSVGRGMDWSRGLRPAARPHPPCCCSLSYRGTWPSRQSCERVARAPPASGVFLEHSVLDQLIDVAHCSILGTLLNLRPLRRCEAALKSVEQSIDHVTLANIECCVGVGLPEA